ncbi:ribonucleoside-diphosphate reductase subunit alpha [Alkalicoccus chagannorensis]|uniref:ribonucleoside-diphosphate reductase subunit alpha n=1 Tax=Alkalicoccus chagannorensis TaxID=427072 RepID=UPI00054F5A60|nr:ribonucleoside-diphosphate reductase subunit alpha [Alkalicoccus chagannorensis]
MAVTADLLQELESRFHIQLEGAAEALQQKGTAEARNWLMHACLNQIDIDKPDYTYAAAFLYLQELYEKAEPNRGRPYTGLYSLMQQLTEKGLYDPALLAAYSPEETAELEAAMAPERDNLFTFMGLFLLADRYLTKDYDGSSYELPQERFMITAMTLMQKESPERRTELVKEAYWAMSNLYMTVATPTLSNAGKNTGQLSSCFIDTVEDSLDGIYLNNWDIARLSKEGGGIGVYMGRVRGLGSDIQGFKQTSSGVVPWIRLINDTAVSVDQLGQRQGAVAVYLDLFHHDMLHGFLQLKTNNGDERRKAHDIFTGVCIPDHFMRQLEKKDEEGRSIGEWSVFCPHQVKQIMGWKDDSGRRLGLEDFYDESDRHYFTEKYEEALAHPLLPRKSIRAMELMKTIMTAQLETGTPYMFYRDEANRQNPNKIEEGRTSIFGSNLCTEIMQNMSASTITEEYELDNGDIAMIRRPGDFVVCNLSSLNLPAVERDDVLERVVRIQMRMLDNVIDLNDIPVPQAVKTNNKYRAVGLGTFGWHQLLAEKEIDWESEEAVRCAEDLYERTAYWTIAASASLAEEKGTYPAYEGSEWESGRYFERRGYASPAWTELQEQVLRTGVRNGWMMAVAPNSSTAKIAGSTDGIDPIYSLSYAEEKKNFKLKVTPPGLSTRTYPYYRKVRHELDQHASIRQNQARQRHIDQGVSFNLYVRHDVSAKALLDMHLDAWRSGLKTTYYVRSTSQQEIEECESCHA